MRIFWFSGTGNTLWAAKKLAYRLKAELTAIPPDGYAAEYVFDDDAVGILTPNYLGDLPWPVTDFLLKLRLKKDCYVFAVVVSSGVSGGVCSDRIDRSLHAGGSRLSLSHDLQMPGNLLNRAAKSEKAILKAAPERLYEILGDVLRRTVNYVSEEKLPGKRFVQTSSLYGGHLLKRIRLKAELCDGCGVCERVCPTGCVTLRDGKPVREARCAGCQACVHWCPTRALSVPLPGSSARQSWHNPDVRLKDMEKR